MAKKLFLTVEFLHFAVEIRKDKEQLMCFKYLFYGQKNYFKFLKK